MKQFTLLLLFLVSLFSARAQIVPCLPECRLFTYPNANFEDDGHYVEYYSDSGNQVHFSYQIKNGKRQGSFLVYSTEGAKTAEASFEDDRLVDNVLTIYTEEGPHRLTLKKDNPGWLFGSNWDCASGTHEQEDGHYYIWLAGQRYRLPDAVVALDI